ncbi:hypothetical protein QTQ03_22235 [Micromonospora sp. WMMA1363]|uniref:hypothetical protein n=1 Tax=Micromonospora sp. WMMA1363 TaxID=3053985 RepID=UPI00259CC3F3|nr:hypothetical protein [Micromonospora sp. WMMA1363]MDM4722173.1 hypothetical protein [Micromonospora sp. WMMA1363]
MVGILGIGVAVALARRQRAVERMHAEAALADQRDRDAAARRERVEQAAKVGRRDSWRIRFEKIDGELDQLVDVASRVLNQGPCTSAGFTALDLEDIQMRAERLADCGIDPLKEPLLELVTLVGRLLDAAISSSATLDGSDLRAAYRLAVTQDRVAHEIRQQVSVTRELLHGEWGR